MQMILEIVLCFKAVGQYSSYDQHVEYLETFVCSNIVHNQ